ncbi:MAG: hypothetical protein N3H84_01545 [Candidatus Caldarchaeum sp.]|nr:hypothetical protein [Candidatus Caldarchaeum sp.]MCX8200774.1 hypothetical protein [Candidatus Caldarchaeum sp.]MDW8435363.1 hypothetical protein [Candidatus Caldarchaeum sp.]
MPRFSVVVEGDRDFQTYLKIAEIVDGCGLFSLQFYEHLPFRPAWGLACSLVGSVRNTRLGPVTVPATLYTPEVNARFLAYLHSAGPGAVLGISRGAYVSRASIQQVVATVTQTVEEVRKITWTPSFKPVIYVGTSGPVLTKTASSMPQVSGIVVDNLANPVYAAEMRRWMDEAGAVDKELVARPFTYITDDDGMDEFFDVLKKYVVDLVDGSPMMAAAGLKLDDLSNPDEDTKAKALDCFAVYGSVDDILEKTAKLLRAGVNHVCFGHPIASDIVEGVKTICQRIIPRLLEEFG